MLAKTNEKGSSIFFFFLSFLHRSRIVELLIKHGADVNATGHQVTPLHVCSRVDSVACAKALLKSPSITVLELFSSCVFL